MAKDPVDKVTGEIFRSRAVVCRQAYDDHSVVSFSTGLACVDESLASQSARDEADINVLVRRFGLTGELPQGVRAPTYGDFTGVGSYQEALNALLGAQSAFMALPAEVRSEFDNDPHRFVDFCSKDENYDRMCDLGLLAPEAMQKRVEARRAREAAELQAKVDQEIAKRQKASNEAGHS